MLLRNTEKDKGLDFEQSGYTSETAVSPETGEKGASLLGPKSCQKPNPKPRSCWDGCQVLQPVRSETYISAWCSNVGEASIAFPSAGFQSTAAPSAAFPLQFSVWDHWWKAHPDPNVELLTFSRVIPKYTLWFLTDAIMWTKESRISDFLRSTPEKEINTAQKSETLKFKCKLWTMICKVIGAVTVLKNRTEFKAKSGEFH